MNQEATMNDRERFLATMNYQPHDRCPWWEMWYWGETLDRWHKEGLPEDVHLQDYLGVDRRESVGVVVGLFPGFKRETLEETDEYEIFRRSDGVICKQFKGDLAGRMPQWLRFPMETREDWEQIIKPRLNPASPARYPLYWEEKKRLWAQRDYPLSISGGSVFGWIRNWMGLEGISQALYDDPAWVQEMMDYLADSIVATVRRAVEEVPDMDYVTMWEDMAYKAGPLISPRMFRQFMLEPYKKITSFFHDHGIHLIFVDSDGDSEPLMELWLEGGVTGY